MNSSETPGDGKDKPAVEGHLPARGDGTNGAAVLGDTTARPRTAGTVAGPGCTETGLPLPPGQHPYDPVKKDLDPIAFALYRVQTYLVWIEEHRAAFEKYRCTDQELAESELSNLRDSTLQAMVYLQRLSELLLAGYTIDPDKRLPDSLCRGWFSSLVKSFDMDHSKFGTSENGTGGGGADATDRPIASRTLDEPAGTGAAFDTPPPGASGK